MAPLFVKKTAGVSRRGYVCSECSRAITPRRNGNDNTVVTTAGAVTGKKRCSWHAALDEQLQLPSRLSNCRPGSPRLRLSAFSEFGSSANPRRSILNLFSFVALIIIPTIRVSTSSASATQLQLYTISAFNSRFADPARIFNFITLKVSVLCTSLSTATNQIIRCKIDKQVKRRCFLAETEQREAQILRN